MEKFYYLFILLISVAYPLASSFDKKVKFYKYWRGVFLGIAVMTLIFVPWDVWFTSKSVWGFNDRYITGFKLAGLPVEEILFFIVVPFACAFIYEVLNYFLPVSPLEKIQNKITAGIIFLSFAVSIVFVDRLYTFTTFSLLALFLIWHLLINRSDYLGKFYLSYIIILIPFVLVNGALTGMFTQEPIVWYNDSENMGIRIITIPLDDFAYNMLMLLIVITILESFKVRRFSGVLEVT